MVSLKEKEQKKIYNEKNRDKINKRQRLYRLNNIEKVKAQSKSFKENHPEKIKESNAKYFQDHRDELLESNRVYAHKNKDKINLQKKEYRKRNPEIMRKANQKWSESNPKKVLERQVRYLTKLGMSFNMNCFEVKQVLRQWSKMVRKRDGYVCVICGLEKGLEAHHILHRKKYPLLTFNIENGITLCDKCHIDIHA